LREGARADIVLLDPRSRWTIEPGKLQTKSFNTPFAGRTLEGQIAMTLCEGQVAYERGLPDQARRAGDVQAHPEREPA
jgi:dihydroorotase